MKIQFRISGIAYFLDKQKSGLSNPSEDLKYFAKWNTKELILWN